MAFKYYRLLLLLPLLGMMKKCEREPAPVFTLPPATQTGANTLGFMVDGRVWRNYGFLPYTSGESDNLRVSYTPRYGAKSFSIIAGQIARDVYEEFSLTIDSLTKTGTYRATAPPRVGGLVRAQRGFIFSNLDAQLTYSRLSSSPTTIVIAKIDTVQHIVAGTFYGMLRGYPDSIKTVSITEGRFDVKYQQ